MNWCDVHHLDLSIEKFCFRVFKMCKNITHIPRIKIKEINIKYTKELKYLGLIFDNNLTWIPHINKLKEKIDHLSYKVKHIAKATYN